MVFVSKHKLGKQADRQEGGNAFKFRVLTETPNRTIRNRKIQQKLEINFKNCSNSNKTAINEDLFDDITFKKYF